MPLLSFVVLVLYGNESDALHLIQFAHSLWSTVNSGQALHDAKNG